MMNDDREKLTPVSGAGTCGASSVPIHHSAIIIHRFLPIVLSGKPLLFR
jgi:hypothetical protein